MADIFLSYSHHDRSKAEDITEALKVAGFSVFWDQSTPSGDDWNSFIREQLTKARLVVTLWSKESVKSRNVIHESTIALEQDKFLPVIIETLPAEQFPMGFYTVQAVDSRGRAQASIERVVAAVRAKLLEMKGDNIVQWPPLAAIHTLYPNLHRRPAAPVAARAAPQRVSPLRLILPSMLGCLTAYTLLTGARFAPEAASRLAGIFNARLQCDDCTPRPVGEVSQKRTDTQISPVRNAQRLTNPG